MVKCVIICRIKLKAIKNIIICNYFQKKDTEPHPNLSLSAASQMSQQQWTFIRMLWRTKMLEPVMAIRHCVGLFLDQSTLELSRQRASCVHNHHHHDFSRQCKRSFCCPSTQMHRGKQLYSLWTKMNNDWDPTFNFTWPHITGLAVMKHTPVALVCAPGAWSQMLLYILYTTVSY